MGEVRISALFSVLPRVNVNGLFAALITLPDILDHTTDLHTISYRVRPSRATSQNGT